MCALAASAAAVGMVVLPTASEARIIYTKAHYVIGHDGDHALDLTHNGTNDFVIYESEPESICGENTLLITLRRGSVLFIVWRCGKIHFSLGDQSVEAGIVVQRHEIWIRDHFFHRLRLRSIVQESIEVRKCLVALSFES